MQTSRQQVESLQDNLESYAKVTLSSFDNLKLVFALISAKSAADTTTEHDDLPAAYEATPYDLAETGQLNIDETSELPQSIYCIKWLGYWIHCGSTASYAAKVQVLNISEQITEIERIEKSHLREVDVPVLTLQQIEFICMEHAHFDHC